MCITIATTKHPNYPFVLLSNRDEYYKRPTLAAHFRPIEREETEAEARTGEGEEAKEKSTGEQILTPLDLARPEHGTWIGVTTSGKMAVLVNYRDLDTQYNMKEISRGVLPLAFLNSPYSAAEWEKNITNKMQNGNAKIDLQKIGGFTLLYGDLNIDPETCKISHLNILSNRGHHGRVFETGLENDNATVSMSDSIATKSTFGLSNSLYNHPWKKVFLGEELVDTLIDSPKTENLSENEFVDECFKVLSHDTYSTKVAEKGDLNAKYLELRNSIFIPPVSLGDSHSTCASIGEFYGTRTQTVILLDKSGNLSYYEKNLHSVDTKVFDKPQIVSHYKFNIYENKKEHDL